MGGGSQAEEGASHTSHLCLAWKFRSPRFIKTSEKLASWQLADLDRCRCRGGSCPLGEHSKSIVKINFTTPPKHRPGRSVVQGREGAPNEAETEVKR